VNLYEMMTELLHRTLLSLDTEDANVSDTAWLGR
jgi:hypothetical protein